MITGLQSAIQVASRLPTSIKSDILSNDSKILLQCLKKTIRVIAHPYSLMIFVQQDHARDTNFPCTKNHSDPIWSDQ